jgi:ABC-type dipeptide/oligopeptide/nickel transport system permease component
MIALGVALVAAGSVAALTNQPLHVSRTLVLSGLIVALVFAITRRGLLRGYQEAELRRTVAADL